MVGGDTGAAMTAVAMVFEMTRDYDIVMPMILAVALSVGVRRMLSPENIYTMKLFRRGHVIPKALHANMFLVRRAKDVMDTDVMVLPADMSFDTFLRMPGITAGCAMCWLRQGERHVGRKAPMSAVRSFLLFLSWRGIVPAGLDRPSQGHARRGRRACRDAYRRSRSRSW